MITNSNRTVNAIPNIPEHRPQTHLAHIPSQEPCLCLWVGQSRTHFALLFAVASIRRYDNCKCSASMPIPIVPPWLGIAVCCTHMGQKKDKQGSNCCHVWFLPTITFQSARNKWGGKVEVEPALLCLFLRLKVTSRSCKVESRGGIFLLSFFLSKIFIII